MDNLIEILNQAYFIFLIFAQVVTVASVIAKFTKSESDDEWFARIMAVVNTILNTLALNPTTTTSTTTSTASSKTESK